MLKMTKLQWLERGYVPADDARGNLEWNNCYYTYKVMRYGEDEVVKDEEKAKDLLNQHKKKLREERKIKLEKEKAELEKLQKKAEEMSEWQTTCQWLDDGRIPLPNATWKSGEKLNPKGTHYKADDYIYCHISDTVEDLARANELAKTYPQDRERGWYFGQPWWE